MKNNSRAARERAKLKEPLCDELAQCIVRNGVYTFIKHPLVNTPFIPAISAELNQMLATKKQMGEDMLATKDWMAYLYLIEKPWRLDAFFDIRSRLTDAEYWSNLSEIWTDSENIWQGLAKWQALLRSPRPGKDHFMSPEERKFLADLPEIVTVYRGYQRGKNKRGLSYTLDKQKAQWFAERFQPENAKVLERTVSKSEIFAYLSGREEDEIIILDAKL